MHEATADAVTGVPETTDMKERVIVSPNEGRFRPRPPEVFTSEGEWVDAGQRVGEVEHSGTSEDIRSPFEGWVMGMLATPGEPVRQGQALFWVRSS